MAFEFASCTKGIVTEPKRASECASVRRMTLWPAARRCQRGAGRNAGLPRPVHIGRTTQVWQIDMHKDAGELTCVSRNTMAVLAPR